MTYEIDWSIPAKDEMALIEPDAFKYRGETFALPRPVAQRFQMLEADLDAARSSRAFRRELAALIHSAGGDSE